jgi:hypothetical protein
MPAKFKKTQSKRSRTSRARRTCKKGGMFRTATGRFLGKGLERADKAKQIGEAIIKGVTHSQTSETFTPAKLSRTFSASPLSPYRMSETPRSSHNANASHFKTPKKGVPDDDAEAPPHLGLRTRRRETQEERMRRLGFMVAPTTMNDAPIVVGQLFH